MVRWPASDRLSRVSAPLIERFKKTSAAKDLEQDPREWVLANWPWLAEAPYAFTARASDGEERRIVIDADEALTVRISHPSLPARAAGA
jgi:hypothetical protein